LPDFDWTQAPVASTLQTLRAWARGNAVSIGVATAFAIGLLAAEVAWFHDAYYSQANGSSYWSRFTSPEFSPGLALQLALIVASMGLFISFVHTSLLLPWRHRAVAVAMFSLACCIEYAWQGALTRYTDAGDIRQFLVVADSGTLTQGLKIFFSWDALLPSLAFAALLAAAPRPAGSAGLMRLAGVLAVMLSFYAATAQASHYVQIYRDFLKYPVPAFNAVFRTLGDYTRVVADTYDGPRDLVPPVTSLAEPRRNIVFVVDESVRGDHLSLNGYHRATTPYLQSLEAAGRLQNWGIASSVTTCSDSSTGLLLSGLRPDDLPDTHYVSKKAPTILQYAKAVGYRTAFFDGLMNELWNLSTRDLSYVDDWRGVKHFGGAGPDVDVAIARAAREVLTTSRGNFLWIGKAGAHFMYHRRFPDSAARWRPYVDTDDWVGQDAAAMVNAYDNAISYNLDRFFQTLLGPDGLADTTIVYTSDHGETLLDHASRTPHCGFTRNEAIVPLFMIGGPPAADTAYRASHPNIFPTLLDLMGVPDGLRQRPYALSLLTATRRDSVPRFFLGPHLQGTQRIAFDVE
jgi:glucan phosphoethanolaminetransferase (alkaline phosphatase superfamily)